MGESWPSGRGESRLIPAVESARVRRGFSGVRRGSSAPQLTTGSRTQLSTGCDEVTAALPSRGSSEPRRRCAAVTEPYPRATRRHPSRSLGPSGRSRRSGGRSPAHQGAPRPGCAPPTGSSEPRGGPHVRQRALRAIMWSVQARRASLRGREESPRGRAVAPGASSRSPAPSDGSSEPDGGARRRAARTHGARSQARATSRRSSER